MLTVAFRRNVAVPNIRKGDAALTDTLPIYRCPRIERELALSGRVDDPLWATAPVVKLSDPVTGQPPNKWTEARLLYHTNYLYIAFTCEDDYVWGTYTERDSPIFREECVEAFICPSGKLRQYYELNVSPRNTVFDAVILNGKSADGSTRRLTVLDSFTCEGLITLVHINGELGVPGANGYSVEYAIPFTSLIGPDHLIPEPGDEWRFNLYRIDSLEADKLDLYAWSPTGARDFHIPWKFGRLVFA